MTDELCPKGYGTPKCLGCLGKNACKEDNQFVEAPSEYIDENVLPDDVLFKLDQAGRLIATRV